jgi:hypothetical protein
MGRDIQIRQKSFEIEHETLLADYRSDNRLNEMILKQYLDAINKDLFKMIGIPQSAMIPMNPSQKSEPDILTKYPITHNKYRRINRGPSTTRSFLGGILPFDVQSVDAITKQLEDGNLEVYAALLRDARLHFSEVNIDSVPSFAQNGHVYDPWFREINHANFKFVTGDKITMSLSANATNYLLYYIVDTTIEGKKIRLFLYQTVKMDYKNSMDTRKHLEKIHPFTVLHAAEYDLNVSQLW